MFWKLVSGVEARAGAGLLLVRWFRGACRAAQFWGYGIAGMRGFFNNILQYQVVIQLMPQYAVR